MTGSKNKLGFARLSMNPSMNKPFPTMADLKSKWGTWSQPLTYENEAPFCQRCNMFGHLFVDFLKGEKLKDKVSSLRVVVVER